MFKIRCAVVVLLILWLCAGCAQPQPSPTSDHVYYSFEDSTGALITLSHKPQKTAVLFSSFAEIWSLAGGQIAVTVGESVDRGFADANTPLVDRGAGKTVDCEMLVSLQPDFVIASADIPAQVQAAALLQSKGVACALFSVEEFQEYLSVLKICTDINENPTAYETYGTSVQTQVEAVLSETREKAHRKRILFIRSGASAASAKAKTADEHFAAAMLRQFGTYNIAENAQVLTQTLSTEEILLQDPDMIFVSVMGDEAASREYMESVLQTKPWQQLTAVRNGKVYFLPKDLFQYKPNHRWGEAYSFLAELLAED